MADGMGTGTVSAAPTHAVVNGLNGTNRSNGEKIGQGQTQQTNGVNGIHTVKHNEAPAVFSWR